MVSHCFSRGNSSPEEFIEGLDSFCTLEVSIGLFSWVEFLIASVLEVIWLFKYLYLFLSFSNCSFFLSNASFILSFVNSFLFFIWNMLNLRSLTAAVIKIILSAVISELKSSNTYNLSYLFNELRISITSNGDWQGKVIWSSFNCSKNEFV